MSRMHFDENCRGCKPALVNAKTGRPLSDDDPIMTRVLALWGQTTRAQREAWHRITCLNSRAQDDLVAIDPFLEQLKIACADLGKGAS